FLRERGLPWRDDSTNFTSDFARNRLRHELLPELARDWNPAIHRTLAHTADWALAEESYWNAEIEKLAALHLTANGGAVILRADPLCYLPLAAARRLLRYAIQRVRGDLRQIDFAHIAAILELARRRDGHGRATVPGLDACRSFDWLRLSLLEPR